MFKKEKLYGILGLARSGVAAAEKIKCLGGKCYLSDSRPAEKLPNAEYLRANFACEFGGHTDKLLECDEWIVSPGIPLTAGIISRGTAMGIKLISELEFGFQIKAADSFLIAVTGSNGKSTTSSLIAHIIRQSGKNCILAGNIGDAFCAFPIEQQGLDYIVLEVSSFQLDLIDKFQADVALLLNITPDHLNRYASFEDYALSKMRVFQNQTLLQSAIINLDDQVIAGLKQNIRSRTLTFSMESGHSQSESDKPDIWLQEGCLVSNSGFSFAGSELKIRGPHNLSNAMAAILACEAAGIGREDIMAGLRSFVSLEHRLQFIAEVKGVAFYNDSKATNTDSVRYALLSFDQPIRIIMGGSDKGEDFGVLTDLLKEHASKVYITGATASQMQAAWKASVSLVVVDDFEQCVRLAFSESSEGDIIVLSPACASFDKFRNFEHRGEVFTALVHGLATENEKI